MSPDPLAIEHSSLDPQQFRLQHFAEAWAPPKEVALSVEKVWSEAQAKNPNLFDGMIKVLHSFSGQILSYKEVPYRYYYAQNQDASLKESLSLSALAVSGCIYKEGQVLVGARSSKVTQYPGTWELVPSGSLDDLHQDWKEVLLQELREETNIEAGETTVTPWMLLQDPAENVIDIVAKISFKEPSVLEKTLQSPSGEYSKLEWLTLSGFKPKGRWVPTSLAILEALILDRGYPH